MRSAFASERPPNGLKPPLQQRSGETLERILDRAETLLDGRDFDTITVAEILEVADVSASSLYRRFGDKDALLRALHVRHFKRMRELTDALASSDEWDALRLDEIVERVIRVFLAQRRNDAPRIQTFRQAERRYPDFEERRRAMDKRMLKLASGYAEKRLRQSGRTLDHKEFALACYLVGCGVEARASTSGGPPVSHEESVSDEWLARSLTRMMSRFLDLTEGT